MGSNAQQLQLQLLEHQVELEESNYKYAVELQKDHNVLRKMRDNISLLREQLHLIREQYAVGKKESVD